MNCIENNDDDDEFGDSSIWEDFDVDAVVAANANLTTAASLETPAKRQHDESCCKNEAISETETKAGLVSSNNQNKRHKIVITPEIQENEQQQHVIACGSIPSDEQLESCLNHYFGYPSFRNGQLEAIRNVLKGNDVTVFWATGSGKSLCYQIPALITKTTAIVVSPLISLMQDQVQRLNGLVVMSDGGNASHTTTKLATYLGSAQTDAEEEEKALQGCYRLVYVTPEKLVSGNFLERLSHSLAIGNSTASHSSSSSGLKLCCIAFDEAHCVSQWGHDFRKDYLNAGAALRKDSNREDSILAKIPIIALTATAIPRIQTDIRKNLSLKNPYISTQSFDRTNLSISIVLKESTNALRAAMEPLVRSLVEEETNPKQTVGSTIIYAPTRNGTEDVTRYLQQRLATKNSSVMVRAYHAGMDQATRKEVHTQFLTGHTAVVVATVAFGMGIDKPDTRRILHWGPPKNVEEYYQQIGRAGRDGLRAECVMYATPSEFDAYLDDFYMDKLSGDAKEAAIASNRALKTFALDRETCRRKALLEYFGETPSFESCGTCDNALRKKQYGNDASRDFGPEARLVLSAVASLHQDVAMGTLEKVLRGSYVENYKYKNRYGSGNNSLSSLSKSVQTQRMALPTNRRNVAFLKEIAVALTQKGYLIESQKSKTVGRKNFNVSWTVYNLSGEGKRLLQSPYTPVLLPVPESLRKAEDQEKARKERVLQSLKKTGVALDKLPPQELETGDGEVIRAYTKWNNYLAIQERLGRTERHKRLEELLSLIRSWRSNVAIQQSMAPATVLPEHVMLTVAYAVATYPSGVLVSRKDLMTAGVRTNQLDSLVNDLNGWIKEHSKNQVSANSTSTSTTSESSQNDFLMRFPKGPVLASQKWEFAVYKPRKKTGTAVWESSYERFQSGKESPQTIAMSPEAGGRPIQAATIVGHIQTAFLLGKPVDIYRLTSISSPPNQHEWAKLEQAKASTGMNPKGDPACSGIDGSSFGMTDFLRPIMGDEFVETPREERTESDKARFGHWCNLLKWYLLLKRTGIEPEFGSSLNSAPPNATACNV